MPTEQTSVSILNMLKLVNSPSGQFITTLWRGKESREMIKEHVTAHYYKLDDCVRNGIKLKVGDESLWFNVICYFL